MKSVSIVFIEVKKVQTLGRARLDVVAQVLVESIGKLDFILLQLPIFTTLLIMLACDYANSKLRHWVPILAILCDGANFEFLVYDSGIKSVYSSGLIIGVVDVRSSSHLLGPSIKRGKVANNLPSTF
jgi:hypothetical protein